MATFHYQAHREDQTAVEGRIEADGLESAIHMLKQQGLTVASIRELEVGQAATEKPPAAPVNAADAEPLALQRQIGRVLEKGKPLAPALLAYAQELSSGGRRDRLERLANQLKVYDPSDGLAPGQFDEAWIPLLSASASSSDPSHILKGIIDESQRAGDVRRRFGQALAYPLLLLAVLIVMMSLFAWFLIPLFSDIFTDFDTDTPHLTRFVLWLSEAIRVSYGLVILIPGLALAAFVAFFAIGPRSSLRDWIVLRMPFFGSTRELWDSAQFTRYLADLMEAEIPIADALRISGKNLGQAGLRRYANRLATEMESEGAERHVSHSHRPNLPHTVTYVLRTNADPRAAAQILRELSWMYDQQASNRLTWISSITSPFFIIVLGLVVGTYVVALFLPLIKLITNLS